VEQEEDVLKYIRGSKEGCCKKRNFPVIPRWTSLSLSFSVNAKQDFFQIYQCIIDTKKCKSVCRYKKTAEHTHISREERVSRNEKDEVDTQQSKTRDAPPRF